jgi:ribosomal protein L39E
MLEALALARLHKNNHETPLLILGQTPTHNRQNHRRRKTVGLELAQKSAP